MKKTIYLHIGTHKTGTTAIQNLLYENHKLLETYDVSYLPDNTIWAGHHYLGWAFRGNTSVLKEYCKFYDYGILNFLEDSINKSECSKFILSSENFYMMENREYAEKFFERFSNFEIKIIVYLRNQLDFLEAWYYEMVRESYGQMPLDFNTFVDKTKYNLDYYDMLKKWETFVGKDNMIIKSYEKAKKNKNLLSDFLKIFQIDDFEKFSQPKITNERMNDLQLLLIRGINNLSLDSQLRDTVVKEILINEEIKNNDFSYSVMNTSTKEKIQKQYALSNQKLFDIYGIKIEMD